jgi:hypothetical protein
LSILCGCGNGVNNSETAAAETVQTVTAGEVGVIQDEDYGGVFITLGIEEYIR